MPSAPASPVKSLSQKAAKLIVLLGPTDGTQPSLEDEVDWLIPQQMSITAGSSRDDVMTFAVDLATLGSRLVDTTAPVALQRQIELRTLDDNGEPNTVLGWGFLAKNPQSINAQAESTSFEARIANFHFGTRLTSYPIYDASRGTPRVDVMRPLVFNPEIDEKIEPNKSDRTDETNSWHYVVDPESMRTAASRTYQQQAASSWKLSDAVMALCWWLNPDETYITNPTLGDIWVMFDARDDLLKNVEIPMGAFLPEALDALLAPFEYGWHLVHRLSNGTRETTIRFFARGEGKPRSVLLQRPGKLRDIKKTNIAEFDAVYDIFELANIVEVHGGFLKRECTFELKKAWKPEYDTKDITDLAKGEAFYEEHPSVGRKFVLNEAGDYIGLRPEITEPFSLDFLFPEGQQTRRRRFQRCLSQHPDADDLESNGYRVDWYDAAQEDAVDPDEPSDPGWVRVTWPFSVLEKECGILFEGTTPPGPLWDLMDDPSKVRVRITATVVGDHRLKGIATKRDSSPNAQDVPLVLDLQDRFQFSKVDVQSIFSGRPSIARDDTTAIQTYAESVRDIEDACHIHCSVTLEGIAHPQYSIGNLIDNVKGRNLTLNAFSPSGGANTRNPQIVGFVWHLAGNQRLELLLDSFERERPQIIHENGHGGSVSMGMGNRP